MQGSRRIQHVDSMQLTDSEANGYTGFAEGTPPGGWAPAASAASLFGDFYGGPQEVFRGLTLSDERAYHEEPLNKEGALKGHLEEELWKQDTDALSWASAQAGGNDASGRVGTHGLQLVDGDEPPSVPSGHHFQLERTTIFFSEVSPVEAGNRLLEFLRQDGVSITKFTPKKFALKADIVSTQQTGQSFEMKARVYKCEGRYAMEFQRRFGEGVLFNNLYQRASKSMCLH